MSKTIARNVYEEITQRIIDALEAGVIPWSRPWEMARYGVHRNAVTGRPYRGLNVVLLNLVASMRGFVDPRWLTYKNAEMLGGHVKKGEKGVGIVFWKFKPVARHQRIVMMKTTTEPFPSPECTLFSILSSVTVSSFRPWKKLVLSIRITSALKKSLYCLK